MAENFTTNKKRILSRSKTFNMKYHAHVRKLSPESRQRSKAMLYPSLQRTGSYRGRTTSSSNDDKDSRKLRLPRLHGITSETHHQRREDVSLIYSYYICLKTHRCLLLCASQVLFIDNTGSQNGVTPRQDL